MSASPQVVLKKGKRPTILMLSDQPEAGFIWEANILQKNWNVAHGSPFDKAIDRLREHTPDLVLIDAQRQSETVLALVRKLRAETVTPLLILFHAIPEAQIVKAYDAGADECIIKPIGQDLLIAKVRSWMRHTWKMEIDVTENIHVNDCVLTISSHQFMIGNHLTARLTNLELRLLYLLMSRSPRAVSHDEIIQRVWDYAADSDYGALKNVIYRLRQKIEVDPKQPKYLLTIPGSGYTFVAQ